MKNIAVYEIGIKGIEGVPVAWNVQKKEIEDEKKKLKRDELSEWEEKNWKCKAEYEGDVKNGKNKVLIPARWIKKCLETACKRTRLNPHFATTKKETYTNYIVSCMVDNTTPVCKIKDLEYYGTYVNPEGKSSRDKRVWCVKPKLSKWKTTFEFVDVFGRMKQEELEELLEYAGHLIGIGSCTSMNFGRFEVTSIKKVKQ